MTTWEAKRTKSDELCDRLEEVAHRLGPGAKLPTSREMSLSYGVSRTTLQLVLERLESRDILSCRQGSGVFVSQHIRRVARKRTVAFVCNFDFLRASGHSAFWDILLEQSHKKASADNAIFQLHLTNPQSDTWPFSTALVSEIRSGQVHGVIGVGLDEPARDWIIEQNVPLVTFASWSPWVVAFDQDAFIHLGVEQLAQQKCRRIGFWRPIPSDASTYEAVSNAAQQDEASLQEAFKRAGLAFDAKLMRYMPPKKLQEKPGESFQEQGYRVAMEVFGAPKKTWPSGIVIADDMMTHGALAAMQKLGVRVGEDVKIASHTNRGSLIFREDAELMTLIMFDPAALVQALFSTLEALMDGQTTSPSPLLIAPSLL